MEDFCPQATCRRPPAYCPARLFLTESFEEFRRATGARLQRSIARLFPGEQQAPACRSHSRPPVVFRKITVKQAPTRFHRRPPVGLLGCFFWAEFSYFVCFLCFLGFGINTLETSLCCSDLFIAIESFWNVFPFNWSHLGGDYSSDFLRSCQFKISSCWDPFKKKRSQLLCAPRVRKDT